VNCSSTWQLQHPHNIILVGHKFGGILIKSLIIEVNKVARRKYVTKEAKDSCEAFRHNLSGIIFYSVPHIMTEMDIHLMFEPKEDIFPARKVASSLGSDNHRKATSWPAHNAIEAINEDFEDSIAHYYTKICVISNDLITEKEVNSLTFMLHHVLDDDHINILAFVEGSVVGKS
jgi:hypothetical protein